MSEPALPIPPNCVFFERINGKDVFAVGDTMGGPGEGLFFELDWANKYMRAVAASVAITHWMLLYAGVRASGTNWMDPEEIMECTKPWRDWGNV